MKWRVEYTRAFLKELAGLPKEIRGRAEAIAFEGIPSGDPFSLGYIEKMKGYRDKFKIRLGDYRIGLTIALKDERIVVQRIVHRKDIYRVFP